MKHFCDITKVKTTLDMGGVEMGVKYTINVDKMNWILSRVYVNGGVDGNPTGLKFYMGFKFLLPSLKKNGIVDNPIEVVPNIILTLEKMIGKKFTLKLNKEDSLEKIGNDIDNFYKVNFLRIGHEGVFERIYGKDAKLK